MRYILPFAVTTMGLMLVSCQQAPAPATVVTPNSAALPVTSSSERTTSTAETKQTTPATINPDGSTAPATESSKTERSKR